MYPARIPIEVQILQDRDVVLAEIFPDETVALRWAELYGERLKLQGWLEAPPAGTSEVR